VLTVVDASGSQVDRGRGAFPVLLPDPGWNDRDEHAVGGVVEAVVEFVGRSEPVQHTDPRQVTAPQSPVM